MSQSRDFSYTHTNMCVHTRPHTFLFLVVMTLSQLSACDSVWSLCPQSRDFSSSHTNMCVYTRSHTFLSGISTPLSLRR
jgi:hypothetical protein